MYLHCNENSSQCSYFYSLQPEKTSRCDYFGSNIDVCSTKGFLKKYVWSSFSFSTDKHCKWPKHEKISTVTLKQVYFSHIKRQSYAEPDKTKIRLQIFNFFKTHGKITSLNPTLSDFWWYYQWQQLLTKGGKTVGLSILCVYSLFERIHRQSISVKQQSEQS